MVYASPTVVIHIALMTTCCMSMSLLMMRLRLHLSTESGRHRESALMNATGFGQEEVVEVLLERGAEVDKQDKLGRTALHRAASRGHERIVTRLLEAGADAGAMSEIGWTALMTAASCGHVSIVRMLLRERAGLVDHRDRDGASALWVACKNGKADVVKVLLLEGGATHDLPDTYFGWTPCQIVKRMGRRSCLKVLQVRWLVLWSSPSSDLCVPHDRGVARVMRLNENLAFFCGVLAVVPGRGLTCLRLAQGGDGPRDSGHSAWPFPFHPSCLPHTEGAGQARTSRGGADESGT